MADNLETNTNKALENGRYKTIELIYALPDEQKIITIQVQQDCNVEQAIKQSGILKLYPELDLETAEIGIFSKTCKLTDELYDKDRIEFYRPLIIDPKEARRNRALKQR